ncbi:YdcF family protein, partial [Aggregatibacter aphrophilus]
MFELKKLLTAMMLPPFNVLILWLLSLFFSLFKCKVFSRLCAFLGIAILYVVSIPYTAQTLKDSLITEDHLTLNDYRQA